MNSEWFVALKDTMWYGEEVSPRGKKTKELLHYTTCIDMMYPVLTVPDRKLSYRFMAAEAYWILAGMDTAADIVPWNSRIAEYSDNGRDFFGAYGPRIRDQLNHVVRALIRDKDTRQATLTTWRPNPPATKDVPCTVAMDFKIRNGKLNAHVFMRSNDIWLGMPYDLFNFSMVAYMICTQYNHHSVHKPAGTVLLKPGRLFLTAASSHIYEEHFDAALSILSQDVPEDKRAPDEFIMPSFTNLLSSLRTLRDTKKGDPLRWWE